MFLKSIFILCTSSLFHYVFSLEVFFGTSMSGQPQTGLESEPFNDLTIELQSLIQKNQVLDINLGNNINEYILTGSYNFTGLSITFK